MAGVNAVIILFFGLVAAQQQCYFGPGAENRGPAELIPCSQNGHSSCCLLGDICFPGGVCWNYDTGNTYQYGCTDINYKDGSCPYKCGWDVEKSPWVALELCNDVPGVSNTWICQSPEVCDCGWNSTTDLLALPYQGCKAMGSLARVAMYAPQTLAPYASLPSTIGGPTGYFSPTVVAGTVSWGTALTNYAPSSIGPVTSYKVPSSIVEVAPGVTPSDATLAAAKPPSLTAQATMTSSYAATTTTGSYAATSTTSTTNAPIAGQSAGSSEMTLSTKIGLGAGLGGGLCLIALVALIIVCLRLRRPKPSIERFSNGGSVDFQQHSASPHYTYPPTPGMAKPAMAINAELAPGYDYWQPYRPGGVGAAAPMELATEQPVYEMESEQQRHRVAHGEFRYTTSPHANVNIGRI